MGSVPIRGILHFSTSTGRQAQLITSGLVSFVHYFLSYGSTASAIVSNAHMQWLSILAGEYSSVGARVVRSGGGGPGWRPPPPSPRALWGERPPPPPPPPRAPPPPPPPP